MASKSKLVEDQITKLLITNKESFEREELKSPTLIKLYAHQNENNVRKLRNIFENKETNDWENPMRRKSTSPTSPTARFLNRARQSFDCFKSLSSSPPLSYTMHFNKTEQILNEIIVKEEEYIETLERGIENYVRFIDKNGETAIEIPHQIRHEKFKLFGNIEEIHLLHKQLILPELSLCRNDVQKLADTFIKLLDDDKFYPYIVYAICYINAKEMVLNFVEFFHALESLCDDALGVLSFIVQPVQKLTRYPLLIEEIIRDLSRHMHENKKTLASLCVAKKKFERHLERMNQSLRLNDIVEAHQLSITMQYGILTSLQIEFGIDVNEPTFLITPKSDFDGFKTPFNVFDLGKFLRIESMECHEQKPAYRFFYGEIFLFEKCLMYTRKVEENSLSYRDKFKYGPGVIAELHQEERSLTLTEGAKVVSFTARSIEKIIQVYDLIQSYDPRKSSDSAFFDGHFDSKPCEAVESEEQYKKDQQTLNKSQDKSFGNNAENIRHDNHDDDEDDDEYDAEKEEDDDDDDKEDLSFADPSSEYEYHHFKSETDEDEEKSNILEISNSRFYAQSD